MINEKIEKKEFITLHVQQCGFAVYGMGPGTARCTFHGQPLDKYLIDLRKKMLHTRHHLNALWNRMNKENPDDPQTVKFIEARLKTGWWALSIAMELTPLQGQCVDGPTNPLRFFFIQRLEELFTKCFAAAWMFGNVEQQIAGRRGLIIDFQSNGGVHLETGEPGEGLRATLFTDFDAHFTPNNREEFVYKKFFGLLHTLATIVEEQHPKCRQEFARALRFMLVHHFGRKDITSPAKTVMLEKIVSLANHLDPVNMTTIPESEVVVKK